MIAESTIFLRFFCGYVWVNIFILSPEGALLSLVCEISSQLLKNYHLNITKVETEGLSSKFLLLVLTSAVHLCKRPTGLQAREFFVTLA